MIKENVKLKKLLTIDDKIALTKELADRHFITGEDGKVKFAPYLAEIALISYFFVYCVDGLVFTYEIDADGNNKIRENVYEEVSKDDELMGLYHSFFLMMPEDAQVSEHRLLYTQMQRILNDVNRMVENKRQELVYKREDVLADFLEYLKKFIGSIDAGALTEQLDAVLKYAQAMEQRNETLSYEASAKIREHTESGDKSENIFEN